MVKEDALLAKLGRRVPAGLVLFREGDAGRQMFVVHSGKVELTRRMGDREAHLAYVPPGEFFGEMAILNNLPRSATATAVEESWLLVIEARTFEQMLRAKTEIAVRMIRLLATRLDQANRQIELLLLRDFDHRIVKLASQLMQQGQPSPEGLLVPLTPSEIAGRVGLSPEEVAATLGRLAAARLLVMTDHGLIVPEVGKLSDFLEFLEMKERFS
jgi:CRP/FNR family transcriptional regulator, cyclic AMP receptor protein